MAWKGVITNSGSELLAQWTVGKTLTITRAAAGTGRVSEAAMLAQTALVSEKQTASILSNKTTAQGQKLQLQVTPLVTGYPLNQLGIWAKLDSGTAKLIALFQTDTDAGVEIPGKSDVPDYVYTFYGLLEFANTGGTLQVTIDPSALATTAALTAAIKTHNESADAHADIREDVAALQTHANSKSNPHGVTKSQVGLGNVPNVATNDQTPTYTEASTLTKLTSGEKLSVAMGKIAKAIADLISHIADKTVHTSAEERTKWNGKADGKHASQHASNGSDPVTPADIGLGNVPNVSTNNQTPTYTQASTLANLVSGEKLSVSFGKIMKAIADLISHLADTTKHITAAERTAWNGKAPGSHNHDDRYYTENEMDSRLGDYLPLAGGTMTGNLTGKYIAGTWLQSKEAADLGKASSKVAVLDDSGWVYYRTPAEILSDIGAAKSSHNHDSRYYTEAEMNTKLAGKSDTSHNHEGRVIQPTSIELFPGTSAGHGGYIDFHFNSDAADFTSRIYEPVKGVLKYNGHGILSTANIVALLNVDITFTNGVATYENSAIKGSSATFVQWRAGAVSTLMDSVLSTTPQNGSMIIVAKAGFTGGPLPVNILIINR